MRNLLKLVAVLFFVVATATVNAQTPKFGHIDLNALIQIMPERATAETEITDFAKELEDIMGDMQKDYQAKMVEFEQLGADASEIKRNAKVGEIQDLQQRIQNYQQTAQQQLQGKQAEVMQPIYEKAQNAIAAVAKENGLLYVYEANQLLYKSNESLDLLPLVKKNLGIE